MMRYAIAIAVAFVIVAGEVVFVVQKRRGLQSRLEQFREELKTQKEAGPLPPEWKGADLDQLELSDVGMELSATDQLRVNVAYALSRYWFFLVPIVLGVCLGIAAVIGKLRGSS